jgi:hypothetical protein
MNQSVIVFADAAARTTAIPSPVEGMLTYLEDTNAYESWNGSAFVNINDNTDAIPKSTVTTAQDLIVADGASSVTRLGVGTDDQVLSVVAGEVAWADASGGGGATEWTLITSTNFSTGSSTSTITGLSGYNKYLIIVGNLSTGSPGDFEYRLNSVSSGYIYSRQVVSESNTFTPGFSVSDSGMDQVGIDYRDNSLSIFIDNASGGGLTSMESNFMAKTDRLVTMKGVVDLGGSAFTSISLVTSDTFDGFAGCRIYGA